MTQNCIGKATRKFRVAFSARLLSYLARSKIEFHGDLNYTLYKMLNIPEVTLCFFDILLAFGLFGA